ncbi:HIT family protein [Desulfomicrobium escambiense]|uniref:HIT family protein n=1 Tax=Desulfomicrobium escambiense TaxID=29503 RepID=UPI000424B047|nr:HIT domain-containing protein [Desulfomicrobium escambiense]
MKTIHAPWRIDYILGPKPDTCVFCLPEGTHEDEKRCVLHRAEHCFVIMNIFPYSNGHLMVTPFRHVSNITELTAEESHEVMDYVQKCAFILQQAFKPHGLNIGVNIGEAAGAGIREHLHVHLVPRWNGDHSFMAVMSETSVLPEHLRSTYERLKPYFDNLQR